MKLTDLDLRQTASYKLGYLRGAMKVAVEMLKHGNNGEAERTLQNALTTVKGISDGDNL